MNAITAIFESGRQHYKYKLSSRQANESKYVFQKPT